MVESCTLTAEQIVRGFGFALAKVLDATRHPDAPAARADQITLELGAFMGVALTTATVPVRDGLTGRTGTSAQLVLAEVVSSPEQGRGTLHRRDEAIPSPGPAPQGRGAGDA